ncbi:MAG: hypothetical protein HZA00_02695 [Nitrospinae bacterium]|nr:hypothetical protein [Nitrospinota bacterium]
MPKKSLLILILVFIIILLIPFAVLKQVTVKRFVFNAMETSAHSLKWAVHWGRYHFNPVRWVFAEGKTDIQIEGGFEGSNVMNIRKVSKNHFEVMMKPDEPSDYVYPGHMLYWFYFKITGAKGETVTIDVVNAEFQPRSWDNYRPVYSYTENPNDLSDHNWRMVTQTERFFTTFSFTHTYESDLAWVASGYPYTYSYLQNYLRSIKGNPYVDVMTVGHTAEGRNIDIVKITDSSIPDRKKKSIWITAGEHAAEKEGSWVAEGIMEFLLSNSPKASSIRKQTVFFIVPLAAPDANYHGRTVNPHTGFDINHRYEAIPLFKGKKVSMTEETTAIWNTVKDWVNKGDSIDVCINLHNSHATTPNVDGMIPEGEENGLLLHKKILDNLDNSYTKETTRLKASVKASFPGRCAKEFGSVELYYHLNQHDPGHRLSLEGLKGIGKGFAPGILDFYGFPIK